MAVPQPEERVSVDLEIRVWGLGADGRVFSQRARAHNISAAGALLCGIERDLKIGDTIGVRSGEKKARCKVVWMMNTQSVQKIQVGVQLVSTLECPWATLLPRSELDEPTVDPAAEGGNGTRSPSSLPCTMSERVYRFAFRPPISAAVVVM